jgi:hypothetical protein
MACGRPAPFPLRELGSPLEPAVWATSAVEVRLPIAAGAGTSAFGRKPQTGRGAEPTGLLNLIRPDSVGAHAGLPRVARTYY